MADLNQHNIEKKFPIKKKYYKEFSPVRSACLFVVKALTKLVEEMHNTVYFDFDQDGLILRATDKDALSKANYRLEQWKESTQIGILTDHIDKEDYKKFIDNELQGLWKKEKAFINVISYDKFYAACEYLEKKGYKEPLKKYSQIYNDNRNFSLLMCTKHRFEEIKDTINVILQPQKKVTPGTKGSKPSSYNKTIQKKEISAPIKTISTKSQKMSKNITWDDTSSDGDNNNKAGIKNVNALELDPTTSFYDDSFPDMSSLNNNNTYNPYLHKRTNSNFNQKSNQDFIDDNFSQQSDNKKSNFYNNKQPSEKYQKPTSGNKSSFNDSDDIGSYQGGGSENYNPSSNNQNNLVQIAKSLTNKKPESLNTRSYDDHSDSNDENEQNKFQFQVKIVVWLINTGILTDEILEFLSVQEDDEEDTYLDFRVDTQKIIDQFKAQGKGFQASQDEIKKLQDFMKEKETLFQEQMSMKILLSQRPIEVYQYIINSTFYQQLTAQTLEHIDLFYIDYFKKTIESIKNPLIQNKAANYLLSKMQRKKNFCFLVAPRKKFADLETKFNEFIACIQAHHIRPLYIDVYQNLVDLFPYKLSKQRLAEIDYISSQNIQEKPIGNNNNKNQDNNNKQAQQQQQPLITISNQQFFVKKKRIFREYDLLKICRNLRIQNFFSADFFVQQFGVKVFPIQNTQQAEVYIFYEQKQMNLAKAIQNKAYKNQQKQLQVATQITESIAFLHNHYLRPQPHGNLKFENILFDENNNIQLTDIVLELSNSKFVPPEFMMKNIMKELIQAQKERKKNNSIFNQKIGSSGNLSVQSSQSLKSQGNYNNKRNKLGQQQQQQQQQNNSNIVTRESLVENYINSQNFIEKQQFNLINYVPSFQSDIWGLGLVLYSLFTGEITDTVNYLLKGHKKMESVMQYNSAAQKKFLKLVLELVDNILEIDPLKRPDINEIKKQLNQFKDLF